MLTSPFSARNAAIAAAAASGNSSSGNGRSSASQEQKKIGVRHNDDDDHCNCPNRCKVIEHLPPGHGLMIMLSENSASSAVQNGNEEKGTSSSSSNNCTCLKLQFQHDTNLTSIHPNIYIPTPLLTHPSHLRKYGGGGSGVTVFGGYHPQLGSLVMKHGGYKDLIELVSLVKIGREVIVRGRWKIDCLMKSRRRILDGGDDGTINSGDDEDGCGCGVGEEGGQWRGGLQTDHPGSINTTITSEEMDTDNTTMISRGGLTLVHSNIDTASSNNNSSTMLKSKSTFLFDKMKSFFQQQQQKQQLQHQQQQQEEISKINDQITQIQSTMSQIQNRIPSFKMIYISPMHLRDREHELVTNNATLRVLKRSSERVLKRSSEVCGGGGGDDENILRRVLCDGAVVNDVDDSNNDNTNGGRTRDGSPRRCGRVITRSTSTVDRKGRDIHLFGADHVKSSSFDVSSDHVDLCFGGSYRHMKDSNLDLNDDNSDHEDDSNDNEEKRRPSSSSSSSFLEHKCHKSADGSDGYSTLMAFVHQLQEHQKINEWKVTLAQKTIGTTFENGDINKSKSARTASSLLYEGKLQGKLLHHLIDEEIQMIRNMQLLTMPEEENVMEQVRKEYNDILLSQERRNGRISADCVSNLMNDFVGRAIHKNFHPQHGRFVILRQFGRDLRRGNVHLTEKEVVPAMHLENLFYNQFDIDHDCGSNILAQKALCDTFLLTEVPDSSADFIEEKGPRMMSRRISIHDHPIFANGIDQWLSLIELSLAMKHPNATNRVWTCGLTDGGLHNLFLDEDQMWAFDLGEPTLEPIPAFLTKFLMSFFHALGKFAS